MKAAPNLQFVLFIDDSRVDGDWQILYRRKMRDCSFDGSGNYIDIHRNGDFDESRKDGDDGYLFFPYSMEFTPSDPSRTEQQQVELARFIIEVLEQIGCRVVIGANFEKRV